MRIGILASGNGTILPGLFSRLTSEPRLQFLALITNRKESLSRKKAEAAGIQNFFLPAGGKTREAWDQEAVNIFRSFSIDVVILVGYMRILSPIFLKAFPDKILNVHPSLLPKFSGGMNMDVHQAVLDSGETESGATIHLVDEGVDTGRILLQKRLSLFPGETPMSLKKRVQQLEEAMYATVLLHLVEKPFL